LDHIVRVARSGGSRFTGCLLLCRRRYHQQLSAVFLGRRRRCLLSVLDLPSCWRKTRINFAPRLAGRVGDFIAVLALIASGVFPELDSLEDALVIAAGRALSIWAALLVYGIITGVKTPWERLTSRHLPALALFVSALSAAVACLLKIWLGVELLEDFARNVSLTVLGDTLGTIIVLAILIRLRKAYKKSVQAEAV